jgi:hypothetical protein
MPGTNPIGTWLLTVFSSMLGSTWKAQIDANFAVAQRFSDSFAAHQAAPAAMAVIVDAGFLVGVSPAGTSSITEVAQQMVTIAASPASPNNRIDLIVVDDVTGNASAIAGTPASLPVAPALTAGKKQLAQVAVPNGTTAIASSNITDLRAIWHSNIPGVKWGVVSGSADTIMLATTPPTASLADGLIIGARMGAANATTTPTLNLDGTGAKTITKYGGQALVAGDIAGALAECLFRYNFANTRWELLNPKAVPPPVTSVAGRTGAVTLAAGDIAGTAWTQASLTNNNQLANGSNFAVRGEGVAEFANNAGYITSVVTGYLAVGSYTAATTLLSAGASGGVSGLPGTWTNMGYTGGQYGCCAGPGAAALLQRIA